MRSIPDGMPHWREQRRDRQSQRSAATTIVAERRGSSHTNGPGMTIAVLLSVQQRHSMIVPLPECASLEGPKDERCKSASCQPASLELHLGLDLERQYRECGDFSLRSGSVPTSAGSGGKYRNGRVGCALGR